MRGDERVRFCESCKLHVYNLSAMTQPEAEELVRRSEGRLCIRCYQRSDGTVLTQDCPVGLAAVRRKLRRGLLAVAASFAVVYQATGWLDPTRGTAGSGLWDAQPFRKMSEWLGPRQAPMLMGKIACPARPSSQPSQPEDEGKSTAAENAPS
jgi:hypothetical protein